MSSMNEPATVDDDNAEITKNPAGSARIEQSTPRKAQKRKAEDDIENVSEISTKDNPVDDYQFKTPQSPTSEKVRLSKKRVNVDPEELHSILDGLDNEIDDALEHAASKNKLTRTNVKNILKHVITNEYVLAMVRNTMKIESGDKDLEEAVFEPKLTRSKVKELSVNRPALPWPSPMKNTGPVTQKLLEEEFPDESSDDEDYEPKEEEEPSDEDDTIHSPQTSEAMTPCTSMTESFPCTPAENVVESYFEEESPLVIATPDLSFSQHISEADKIALRTRSKLCLNDTPLEELEASFFAPDITVDMYDTTCDGDDDWLQFLTDLGKPIDTEVMKEQVTEADDPEDDPEYNAQEDDDSPDPLDFSDDPTTKVSRNELNALMAEILEFAQQEYMDDEDDDENKSHGELNQSSFLSVEDSLILAKPQSEWMTSDEKLQLDEQIRMYVQLLTQSYLLSYGLSDLNFLNISCKLFLDELKMFASRGLISNKRSVFNAHNLEGALNIVNKTERHKIVIQNQNEEMQKERRPVPTFARRIIAANKVFIYPELLPVVGYPDPFQTRKCVFAAAEDNLIALGLEQFNTISKSTVDFIHSLLVPSKTPRQIKVRIKNCRISRVSLDNPIKYCIVHNEAPQFPRIVRIFDPDNVKIPAEFPLEVLPKWMTYYCKVVSGHTSVVPPPIAPSQTSPAGSRKSVPTATVPHKMFRKKPKERKSRLILPFGGIISPLRQINPILKKYSQPKKPITVLPITLPCPHRDKSGRCVNKMFFKPRAIKPKPVMSNDNYCIDSPEKHTSFSNTCSPIIQQTVPVLLNTTAIQPTTVSAVQPLLVSTNSIVNLSFSSPVKNNQMLSNEPCSSSQMPHLSEQIKTNSELCSNAANEVVTAKEARLLQKELIEQPITNSESICNTEIHSTSGDVETEETLEEMPEDEPDASSSSTVATTIAKKQTVSKKKNKLHKDLESSLALLRPAMINNDPKKEERETLYVNSFLLRAQESLKSEPETWNLFLLAICKYQFSTKLPIKLYLELKVILKNHPALLDDFVAFLKPAEAEFVGKYKEYLMLNKIREFLRKIEVHFSNQPHHIPRIVRALSQFRQQTYVTSAEALAGLQPLLRNQTHLMEELSQLIPDAPPPVYLQTDFEDITLPNSDEDISSNGSCENITIPDTPDPYGGKECPCKCHTQSTDSRMLNRSRHCVKCGVKFIDGRIYLQTGKVLKPAQVTYHEIPSELNDKKVQLRKLKPRIPLFQEAAQKALIVSESNNKQEGMSSKKDSLKSLTVNSNPVVFSSSEPLLTSSNLPCDVIEDTVFPSTVNSQNKSTPSDFSHLRDMIGPSKENQAASDQSGMDTNIALEKKWSEEEDKLIIYNCQRLGLRKEAFLSTAKILKTRTAAEVEQRFFTIVEQSSKEMPKQ